MSLCRCCRSENLGLLLDLGPQPLGNRFLADKSTAEYRHPLVVRQCRACGLVQIDDPVPVGELAPRFDWITYNEPEGHLDALAEVIRGLPGITADSVVCGVSYKDDSTLARLEKLGMRNTWRLDAGAAWGINRPRVEVETIQDRLTPAAADSLLARHPRPEVVLARHILEHAHQPSRFAQALQRLVHPQGYVVFESPDCGPALDNFEYTTLWEEHILYFTPGTFRRSLESLGFSVFRYESYPYPFENSLVGIVHPSGVSSPAPRSGPPPWSEINRGRAFADQFPSWHAAFRETLARHRAQKGKIALMGAGHLACTFLNLFEAGEFIDFVADDNPHKQGLFMPGSRLPIHGSEALLSEDITLCLLSVGTGSEERVLRNNEAFSSRGGTFASIFPHSDRAIVGTAHRGTHPLRTFKEIGNGVFAAGGASVGLDRGDLGFLTERVDKSALKRVRLCAHEDAGDLLHEMFICLSRETYIRPHKHLHKAESLLVIEGRADAVFFDDEGAVTEVMRLGEYRTGKKFYYRIAAPMYHTLVLRTPLLLFHEATTGPFRKEESVYAPWSPDESDPEAVRKYMARVARAASRRLREVSAR